ncbi:unnamed protein product [Medioppia subpectinata]|uniref:Uncharacterized protein n=1 Tax=Medioppia subpectinata TaxID=1979941 RepID=A0A7R9KX02_9ACAR|nr:unnamed protein product [Medioppia subpectinata]CAG2110119.1 unnamed protein product [Medioppia subpectinata]
MSALKASNESEVKALKAQLKSAMDSMQTSEDSIKTWIEGNNDLKQKLLTCISSFRKEITDLKQKLCEISTKNSELSEELSALKASKHIIESDVKLLAQDINALNISCSASVQQDMSSMSSSIGSHNQLTTNSDKTGDENNIQEMFIEIGNQIKDQNKITNNLLKALVIEKEITLTALKDIRQSVEDSDDSKSMASVDSHPK